MVVVAGVLFSMIAIIPMAIADRDDDDDDDDDNSWGKKKRFDNQVTLIERSYSVELQPTERLNKSYFCDEGEIIVGGLLMSKSTNSLSSGNWDVQHQKQAFYVNISDRDKVPITVDVTYLCASMKSWTLQDFSDDD